LSATTFALPPEILVDTGFEAPTFVAGGLNGQNGWNASSTWSVVNNPAQASTGDQFVQNSMTASSTAATTRFAWVDTPQSGLDLAGNNHQVLAVCDVALDATSLNGARLNTAGIQMYADNGNTLIGAIQLRNFSATSLGVALFNSAGAGVGFTFTPALTFGTYFELAIIADYSTHTLRYFIEGSELIGGGGFSPTFAGSIDNFSDADLVSSRASSTTSSGGRNTRYDNFLVAKIPAPGAMALLGLGGLVAARRRRSV
jgi:hypothetical protein